MSKRIFVQGVVFSALSRYSSLVVNLVVTAILSRILLPNDFGVIALASVCIAFFSILSESGFGVAIIQKKDLDKRDISNIFTITIFIAIISSCVLFLATPLLSRFYAEPRLDLILKFLSLNLFFSVINIVPNGLLLKEKQFKYLSIANLFVQLLCGLIAITIALNGFGIFALLVNPILGSFLVSLLNIYRTRIVPGMKDILHSVRKIFSYSVYQFLFAVINYFSRNLDNLIIGKYLGLSMLGYYEKSYRLMLLPVANLTNVINSVAHPVLSDFQHDADKLERKYRKIVEVLVSIGFPLSVFLYFNSEFLVLSIFGSQWEKSVDIFRILSVSIGFQIVVSSAGSIFQSINKTQLLFIDGLLSTMLVVSSLFVGVFYYGTIDNTVCLYVIAIIFNFFKSFFILYKFGIKRSVVHFFNLLIVPGLLSIFFGSILQLLTDILSERSNWFFFFSSSFFAVLTIFLLWRNGTIDFQKILEKLKA